MRGGEGAKRPRSPGAGTLNRRRVVVAVPLAETRVAHAPAPLTPQEYVNGQLKNKYGDAFIRGNNVLYISTATDK